jgi:hypothetical protein
MNNNIVYKFLESFFALFEAAIKEYKIEGLNVHGSVGWIDEDEVQVFLYKVNYNEEILSKIQELCKFLYRHKLINGDKIKITEPKLLSNLTDNGWTLENAKEAVDCLCATEIKMIDEGVETDSFFIHF